MLTTRLQQSVVEYVDPDEQNFSMIAMNPTTMRNSARRRFCICILVLVAQAWPVNSSIGLQALVDELRPRKPRSPSGFMASNDELIAHVLDSAHSAASSACWQRAVTTACAAAEKRRVTRNSPNAHFCENCFLVFFSLLFLSYFQWRSF